MNFFTVSTLTGRVLFVVVVLSHVDERRWCVARLLDGEKMARRFIADGRGAERAPVEFDDGAAAWREVIPENAGPGRSQGRRDRADLEPVAS